MPTVTTPSSSPGQDRPSNREVENENQRPARSGKPPRPATEPRGAETSSPKTRTDPGSGEA